MVGILMMKLNKSSMNWVPVEEDALGGNMKRGVRINTSTIRDAIHINIQDGFTTNDTNTYR